MKKTILTGLVMVVAALQASAFRPIPIRINGTELASTTRFLPEFMISNFLDGAIWAPIEDVSSVNIDHIKSLETYAVGCFVVNYKSEAKRPAECYVITYRVEQKGILDAVLAYVNKDITLCQGGFMFPDRFYQLESRGNKCQLLDGEFNVVRSYTAMMGNEGGDLLSEKGTVTRHYTIDDKGIITADPKLITDAVWSREPNRSIPGRQVSPDDIEQEKIDQSRVLGPGIQVLDFYATPLHRQLTDQDFDGILQWTETIGKGIGSKYAEPLAGQIRLWQERVNHRLSPKADTPQKGKKSKKSKKKRKRK